MLNPVFPKTKTVFTVSSPSWAGGADKGSGSHSLPITDCFSESQLLTPLSTGHFSGLPLGLLTLGCTLAQRGLGLVILTGTSINPPVEAQLALLPCLPVLILPLAHALIGKASLRPELRSTLTSQF